MKEKGFTLAEALVVFTLLGILSMGIMDFFDPPESQNKNPTLCLKYGRDHDFCTVGKRRQQVCFLEDKWNRDKVMQVDCSKYPEELASLGVFYKYGEYGESENRQNFGDDFFKKR